MVTVGSGVRRICVLPRSTSFSKLQPAAGVSEGSNLTRMLAPWILVGVLQLTSLDFAMTLFGMIATSWFPVRMCVARQLVSITVPWTVVVQNDPVAHAVRALDVENDAGEDISERALQRQTDNDRQSTGGRQQTFHRQIENIGDDCESCREVDESGQQVLNQFRFARLSPQHDERTQETDREPRRAQPPDDFERAHEETLGFGTDRHAGAIRNNAARQQQAGEDDKHQKLDEKMRQGTASLPIAGAEEAGDDHDSRQKKRVGRRRQNRRE